MKVFIGIVLICVAAAQAPLRQAAAAEGGYWVCVGDDWVPQGSPAYPAPLKRCGAQLEVPRNEAECLSSGGRWAPIGLFPAPVCTVPTADGGRICGDTEECQGLCLATLSAAERDGAMHGEAMPMLGRCSVRVPTMGCQAIVRHGIVAGLTCFD